MVDFAKPYLAFGALAGMLFSCGGGDNGTTATHSVERFAHGSTFGAVLRAPALPNTDENGRTLQRAPISSLLAVSANGRYFVNAADGTPFFWLGDTAWMLFSNLTQDETLQYLNDRATRGFTVVQAYLVNWNASKPNHAGETPFFNDDMGQPNPAYFDHVEWVIDHAAAAGLQLVLGPAELGSSFSRYYDAGAAAYGTYLGQRFKNKPNIVWMMCGDRDPNDNLGSVRAMALAIKNADPNHLMTCHPDSPHTSAEFLPNEGWIDFNMAQSWAYRDEVYSLVRSDYDRTPAKPAGMAEPAYEDDQGSGGSNAHDVRKMAYRSVFAGGYITYGQTPLWNFQAGWQSFLGRPGATQLGSHLKSLMGLRRWWAYVPDQSLFASGEGSGWTQNVAIRSSEGAGALFYLSDPTTVEITLSALGTSGAVHARWFNPTTGALVDGSDYPNSGTQPFSTPNGWEDAVLALDVKAPPPEPTPEAGTGDARVVTPDAGPSEAGRETGAGPDTGNVGDATRSDYGAEEGESGCSTSGRGPSRSTWALAVLAVAVLSVLRRRRPHVVKWAASLAIVFAASRALAADPNGYDAEYECRAGGPHCNVDVAALGNRACDQTIYESTPWSAIDWSKGTICLEAGDHTPKGTLTIPSSANGSAGNYKVLRYGGNDPDDPWNQSSDNQAKLHRLDVGGDYWVIHRLTLPGLAGTLTEGVRVRTIAESGDVKFVVFNRLLIEGAGSGSHYYGYSQDCSRGSYTNLTVQNSVFRNLGPLNDPREPTAEAIALDISCGSNMHYVNNEIYDWVSHPIQVGTNDIPVLTGIVIENSDLYVTPALYTNGGAQAKAESVLSMKVRGTAASPVRIIHNRLWGARETDLHFCCNGEGGDAVTYYQMSDYVLFQGNIIFDSQVGINNVAPHTSYVGNIFWKLKIYSTSDNNQFSVPIHTWQFGSSAAYLPWPELNETHELYLNTIVDSPYRSLPSLEGADVDTKCNVVAASGPKTSGSPPPSSQADFNDFYDAPSFTFNGTNTNVDKTGAARANATSYSTGTVVRSGAIDGCTDGTQAACFLYKASVGGTSGGSTPTFCTTLGCTSMDGSVTWQAFRGPFAFKRKLRTVAGGETVVVPYAKPHTSAFEHNACPNTIGARSGIGINDDVAGWPNNSGKGLFGLDLEGKLRTGTSGALEAGERPMADAGVDATTWPGDGGYGGVDGGAGAAVSTGAGGDDVTAPGCSCRASKANRSAGIATFGLPALLLMRRRRA